MTSAMGSKLGKSSVSASGHARPRNTRASENSNGFSMATSCFCVGSETGRGAQYAF